MINCRGQGLLSDFYLMEQLNFVCVKPILPRYLQLYGHATNRFTRTMAKTFLNSFNVAEASFRETKL